MKLSSSSLCWGVMHFSYKYIPTLGYYKLRSYYGVPILKLQAFKGDIKRVFPKNGQQMYYRQERLCKYLKYPFNIVDIYIQKKASNHS